jgi:L-fucose isomerase-like protein
MSREVVLFWPGDYRPKPNEWARPSIEQATAQMSAALVKLGRKPRVLAKFITKPHESIRTLGPIDDPMVAICVHWFYGPHTVEGVVGKENPLLLASNFSGRWPGLVGLLNTAACLQSVGRPASRLWTEAADWTKDAAFMERLDEWCTTGAIRWPTDEIHQAAPVSADQLARARQVLAQFRKQRPLILMLGDTSMGMVNGCFGNRTLAKLGFSEHKVDQAWIPPRAAAVAKKRVDQAFDFVQRQGVRFHWREKEAEDFTEETTREQLAMYLAVLDLVDEFGADCIGWQYQLGLWPVIAPSDFCEGLLNSKCRPESNGDVIITATEADQGNVVPMEMLKRLLKEKGLHQAVMFHDVRWGGRHDGRFLWVLLNSGSCGAYAFNHDPESLEGVHSYRQPAGYFPKPGGTFAGESLPGKVTWARAWLDGDVPWMDVGRGEVVKLPAKVRDEWWNGTTRQWPFMACDLGCSMETLMAHYMSNHVAVAYGDVFGEMVALSRELGFKVRVLASDDAGAANGKQARRPERRAG